MKLLKSTPSHLRNNPQERLANAAHEAICAAVALHSVRGQSVLRRMTKP
jgi:hypothetical protein